ncbi:GL21159 [Drosophila persimilis]|uniref:GL21159 n=1 Tax=Drosophila persimilis TaxID=7234 RepID=B4GX94_DROPE|nr:GL21159 [Drosophila persimilis]
MTKFSEQMASSLEGLTIKTDAWGQKMLQKDREMRDLCHQLHSSQEALAKLKAESEPRQGALNESVKNLKKELAKIQVDRYQLSCGTKETIRELKDRLEITNTDLQHKQKMALEDAQKISDLKTLVEVIHMANSTTFGTCNIRRRAV